MAVQVNVCVVGFVPDGVPPVQPETVAVAVDGLNDAVSVAPVPVVTNAGPLKLTTDGCSSVTAAEAVPDVPAAFVTVRK